MLFLGCISSWCQRSPAYGFSTDYNFKNQVDFRVLYVQSYFPNQPSDENGRYKLSPIMIETTAFPISLFFDEPKLYASEEILFNFSYLILLHSIRTKYNPWYYAPLYLIDGKIEYFPNNNNRISVYGKHRINYSLFYKFMLKHTVELGIEISDIVNNDFYSISVGPFFSNKIISNLQNDYGAMIRISLFSGHK